ncbi:MAG: type II toxin-antitoxin system RelE/ParE family toxin [Bacteroidota bacterium]|nr:type II toxin-antitoxin system RelE/ParE family toxin [Bacteroidota bacterium]MDP3145051.1 type II toxin-antitoxin system RelE/ParE family toxin [Bacteroidota bacterium]MDP3556083.1 type II toxin-antitoxin system RelE/ParE family toxin [Bacteroidota bacterium]
MVKKNSFKIIWDRNALDNFKEILTFLSKQSTLAPKIVKEGVLERLDIIRTNALICEIDKLKNNSDKEFRAFIIYSYRITYQIKSDAEEIRIIRIRHTSREPLGY